MNHELSLCWHRPSVKIGACIQPGGVPSYLSGNALGFRPRKTHQFWGSEVSRPPESGARQVNKPPGIGTRVPIP